MPLIEDAEFVAPEDEPEEESPADPLPEFDPRHRDDFTGLLYLGALQKTFSFCGHKFTIRTLRTDEYIAVGLLVKEYEGTQSGFKAYVTALIAAALVTIDGTPLESPFRDETTSENLQFRMDKVAKWSPFLIDVIYNEYLALDNRVNEVFDSMGKA